MLAMVSSNAKAMSDVVSKLLECSDLEARSEAVAICATKPAVFGADFFAELLVRSSDAVCAWYAIRSLGTLQSGEYLPLLIDVIQQPNVVVGESSLHRITANSIGLIGAPALGEIVPLLNSSQKETRLAAIDTVGEIRAPEGAVLLEQYLASEDVDSAIWAALSLVKIGSLAVDVLTRQLRSATSARTAFIIFDALATMCIPEVLHPLAMATREWPEVLRDFLNKGAPARSALVTLAKHVAARSESSTVVAMANRIGVVTTMATKSVTVRSRGRACCTPQILAGDATGARRSGDGRLRDPSGTWRGCSAAPGPVRLCR